MVAVENPVDALNPIPDEALKSFHSECLKRGVYKKCDSIIEVDLSATNEALVSSFSKWLREKRKEISEFDSHTEKEKDFTVKDCRQWVQNKILQYLDIKIVADSVGIKIPNHIIGKFLFPDEFDVDLGERIRKVVKPSAESIMYTKTLDHLIQAASKEAGKKRNDSGGEIIPE